MNVTLDITPKQIQSLRRKQKETTHSFPLSWSYIKYCTRKTVYERVLFLQSSYILKEVKSINLKNLHSLCEQVNFEQLISTDKSISQIHYDL